MVPETVPSDSLESSDGKKQPISWWILFWSALSVVLSAAVYLTIFLSGSSFRDLFRGFGTDLPVLTQFVLVSFRYYGFLVLVGAIPCVSLFRNRRRFAGDEKAAFVTVLAGFGLSLAVLTMFVVAMYLPMFAYG